MYKIKIGLLLCMSLSLGQVKAGDILKAINSLNIPQVEKEIKERGKLESAYKLRLIDVIEEKIVELKKKQGSKSKYLNPQLILGALTTGLATRWFTEGTSTEVIGVAAYRYQEECRALYNAAAPNLPPGAHEDLAQELKALYNKALWIGGLSVGVAGAALAAVGLKQLYNGLTTKKLKDNYQKALAIKTLIQQAPTE